MLPSKSTGIRRSLILENDGTKSRKTMRENSARAVHLSDQEEKGSNINVSRVTMHSYPGTIAQTALPVVTSVCLSVVSFCLLHLILYSSGSISLILKLSEKSDCLYQK